MAVPDVDRLTEHMITVPTVWSSPVTSACASSSPAATFSHSIGMTLQWTGKSIVGVCPESIAKKQRGVDRHIVTQERR